MSRDARRLVFPCCGEEAVDPGPASSSFCPPAGFGLGTRSFLPGCLDGCLAARDAGRVWTSAYSERKRCFMEGSL